MSDVRTLRLASIALTRDLVDRFVTYQRMLLAELIETRGDDWAGRFAFAHTRALTASGLDAHDQNKVRTVVTEFCGRRSNWLKVKQKVAESERELASGKGPAGKTEAVLKSAKAHLPALEDFSDFIERYGTEALTLLRERELELVTLHQDVVRVEAEGGSQHLHRG